MSTIWGVYEQIRLILPCNYVKFDGESKEGGALENTWKVFMTHSDAEPWWFFENWTRDIVTEWEFDNQKEAIRKYLDESERLSREFPNMKTKKFSSVAFWDESEVVFCEACDDDLQMYHGIILFENGHLVESDVILGKLKEELQLLMDKKNR